MTTPPFLRWDWQDPAHERFLLTVLDAVLDGKHTIREIRWYLVPRLGYERSQPATRISYWKVFYAVRYWVGNQNLVAVKSGRRGGKQDRYFPGPELLANLNLGEAP